MTSACFSVSKWFPPLFIGLPNISVILVLFTVPFSQSFKEKLRIHPVRHQHLCIPEPANIQKLGGETECGIKSLNH